MALRKVVQVLPNTTDQTIELIMFDGRQMDVKVNLCKIVLDFVNNLVYLYDASQSNTVIGSDIYEPNYYTLDFNIITNPIVGNATALYYAVLSMLAEAGGGGGGGTATDTNQVIQINELKNLSGETSVFKDSASDESVFIDKIYGTSVFNNSTGHGVFYDLNADTSVFIETQSGNSQSVFLDQSGASVFYDYNNSSTVFKDVNGNSVFKDKNTDQSLFWDEINNTSVFKTASLESVFIDELSGLSWLQEISTNIDITLTAQANIIRGGAGATLSDINAQLANVYGYVNAIYNTLAVQQTGARSGLVTVSGATHALAVTAVLAQFAGALSGSRIMSVIFDSTGLIADISYNA